ncbi:hypothetical protein J3U65_09450 [Gilliamella sp. B3791]|uniref:hypothetical protein n=1 Tax=unclassified Gilliamella TaxID=2685620 RepID=UPI00226A25CD|nr:MULTISPECIES: hypothetical protein [unclassified Gilliamella]MCX8642680.1 hypothetical protein [Gilliamella sp. B3835]MCX8708090.1 hypothetical protein [Gilliamella sp. B3783]MCX8709020.1 hypothetical protein [Gilliamella sp. B3780]MCX8712568.1 hypothetical protein [Gilliamella sp. B3468]MCX8717285.1 hypothetical protein [Gilliamella sp. B3784]
MSVSSSKKAATVQQNDYSVRQRQKSTRTESPQANIQNNTFFKVIFSDNLSLEQKVQEVTQILEFTDNKEIDREKVEEFDKFKEYLQSISEEMSKQRIEMTDTEVFAELQRVYADFNNDLNDFIDKIKPLTEITDALYNLRQNGETRNALAQIKADQEWDDEKQAEKKQIQDEITNNNTLITKLKEEIHTLEQDRIFFGLGKIKAASKAKIAINQEKIAQLEQDIQNKNTQLANLEEEIKHRHAQRSESLDVEKLKELLNLTSDEHTLRQADMVESALKFVNQGKERFGAIRGHLEKMVKQIEGLSDNNGNMIQIYAIMNEATKQVEKVHRERRQELENKDVGDNLLESMKLEETRRNLDEHIDTVSTATVDTMQTYGELTTEAIKIRNMQAATKKQVESARAMHSRGIASVASQLSVVVTAVNSAAINEAQSMAGNTLAEMARVTNDIAKNEAIRIATGRDEINNDLEAMLQNLAEFGDTQREATEITRSALETMRANLEEIEKMSKDVQGDTREFIAVTGDVLSEKSEAKKETKNTTSPFKL